LNSSRILVICTLYIFYINSQLRGAG